MNAFNLPKAHTLRAKWVPLHFYPMLGSNDCMTVAVVAIDAQGNCKVVKSSNLDRLNCLFGNAGKDLIKFINMAVDAVQDEVLKRGVHIFDASVDLGASFSFGTPTAGSGFDLDSIARSWLNKISILQLTAGDLSKDAPDFKEIQLAGQATLSVREKKIVPAIRDEFKIIAPRFIPNFNKEFIFKNRKVAVKLNYSGDHLVAAFDRVSPRHIDASLEKVRSKLWVLAEHRDQTLHEVPRLHEMLVVPTTVQDLIVDHADMKIVNEACDDIEKEADRREIRLRRFPTTRALAAHIYSVESRSGPRVIN